MLKYFFDKEILEIQKQKYIKIRGRKIRKYLFRVKNKVKNMKAGIKKARLV